MPSCTLIIRAAEQLGTIVPRFCDHPLLDPIGACRQCMVEIEGQRKPMMSCTTPAADGMVVKTHLTSELARQGQASTLEFLLINHPLDCPMCDKGGECPLQDQALSHGSNVSRFVDQKRRYAKPVAVSPLVLLDRERCVLCARCTRFSNEISGHPFIELFERGALEQVAIYADEPYDSYFSGNVIQICPVGALTSTSYRFKARPFDVRTAASVCDHCSAGCNLTVQSRRGDIQRQLARTNMAVNEAWNCDRGRFGFKYLTAPVRLTRPQLTDDDELVDVSWADALMRVVGAVQAARQAGPGRVAVLTGSRLADEDAYAVSKYARTVLGSDDVDFRLPQPGTVSPDELTAVAGRDAATYADVEQAPVIVTVGLDPEEEVPILFLRIRKAWRNHRARIVPVGPRAGTLDQYAWRHLPTAPGGETAALTALTRAAAAGGDGDAPATGDGDAPATGDVREVADALRAGGVAVVLVGERAPAGALAAAAALAARVGAKLGWVPRRAGARGALDAGLVAGALPGGRRLDDADDHAAVAAAWGELPAEPGREVQALLEAAADGHVDVLHLVGLDLARDCPYPDLARRALERTGTVVVQDVARTDTTAYADVVLPVTATQERSGTYTDWEGRRQRFTPAVDGPQAVQDDWEVVVQLSGLLGHDLGFNDLDAIRAERDRLGRRAAAHDWPTPPSGATGGEDEDGEELRLVTYPLLLDRATMLTGADDVLATAKAPFVALHRSDADRLGVAEAVEAEVAAGDGAPLRLPVAVEAGMAPGTVYVPANSCDRSTWELLAAGGRVTVTAVAPAAAHAGDDEDSEVPA